MPATPIDRPMQVAIASSLFFHQGRAVPVCTSSASNTACTPLAASQKKVRAASGATDPPGHEATRATCR